MCRAVVLAILCSLLLAGSARAASRSVSISAFEFRPAQIAITAGDAITWRWDGPDTDHSVTAAPGGAQAFDSDPGVLPGSIDHPVGYTFAQTFSRSGTYQYFCKVHPAMRGVVVVRRLDRSAPGVRSLRVRPRRAGIQVRFVLSERARVMLRIARIPTSPGQRGPGRSRKLRGRRGANDVRVSARDLLPGRYRVTLTARDAAGNTSQPAARSFRIRRAPAQ